MFLVVVNIDFLGVASGQSLRLFILTEWRFLK